MASPGKLVQTLAQALDLPEASLVHIDRGLVVAGLRSKGGRGRSAARVTPRDAAVLLVAILAGGLAKDAPTAIHRYLDAHPLRAPGAAHPFADLGLPDLAGLPLRHSFIDAVATLILCAGTPQAPGVVEVAATSPGTLADLRIAATPSGRTAEVRYVPPGIWPANPELRSAISPERLPPHGDLQQYRRITQKTLNRLAACLAE